MSQYHAPDTELFLGMVLTCMTAKGDAKNIITVISPPQAANICNCKDNMFKNEVQIKQSED